MSFWIVGQVVPSLALSNISFVSETDTSSHLTIHIYGKGWSISPWKFHDATWPCLEFAKSIAPTSALQTWLKHWVPIRETAKTWSEHGQWPQNFPFLDNWLWIMSHLCPIYDDSYGHCFVIMSITWPIQNFYGHLHFVSIFKLGKSNIFTWSLNYRQVLNGH